MDNLSYRNHGPARRPSGERSDAAASVQPENHAASRPQSSAPSPKKGVSPSSEKKPSKHKLRLLFVAVIVALAGAGLFAWSQFGGSMPGSGAIDTSKYQAVFFTNGQVYFGKLQTFDSEYLKLTDIYYLQTQSSETSESENPQKAATNNQGDVQLIKLGDEVHGPEDEMIISRDQVLFYENLKADGKVSQSIKKFQSSKN